MRGGVRLLPDGEIKRYPRDVDEDEGSNVLRAAPSFFLRRWDEHVAVVEKAEAYQREAAKREAAAERRKAAAIKRLEALGVHAVDYYDDIRLSVEKVETLLILAEAKK